MAKGKQKTLAVEPCKNKAEREAKENKHETKMTCPEQSTPHSFASPLSPHRKSPLFPINEENSSTWKVSDTSKHGDVRLTVELPSNQENNGARISSLPKEKTVTLREEGGTSGVSLSNKPELGTHVKVKVNKPTQKKAESKNPQHSRKVTDYYPIRRSSRKSKAELKSEEQRHIDDLITNNVEDGLQVKNIEGKGRGVFADRDFRKGQFIVEYHGDLLQIADAKKREAEYAQDPTKGCYMYYFHHLNKNYCVDATKETDRLGRLINHSKNGNCQTKLHNLNGVPHLIFVASRDIKAEEELLYDYGDRSKEAIAAHPWLKQ
ncbi:lysine methyltransferase 5Ab isoform X2 [Pygocentrus nattereri]|uniref:[histone H4]-lysine(20) N-methyltransferase n=1 Tax=Pygocentrus nattereri TaxID=42514 RepID=A0AAR2KJS7_PYGNA|nr:lysine methyltransferase 5Ab isoform X2 [Pygocentrus nattereri]